MLSFQSEFFTLQNSNKINVSVMTWKSKVITARPRDTRILVPEKNRAAQNRASWGLYLCTKWDFFYKNRVSSRLLFKIRASWGYTYVLKGIFIDFFLAYLAIGTFFNWDLWTIETFKQLGIGMFMQLGPLAIGTFGQLEIVGSS